MKLSSSKIKKVFTFPKMRLFSLVFFLYFRKELSKFEKLKRLTLKKIILFLAPKLKKFYFRKWNFLAPRLKNFLYFRKWNFLTSYFSYISGRIFLSSKKKKKPALKKCFGKWNFLAPSLKNSCILGGNFKVPNLKKFLIIFFLLLRVFKNKFIHCLS